MSTPKERLRMIFAGEKPDRPACICPGGMMNMVTEDLMEEIKTYMRGHNLFDIFYGRYKKEEKDLLKKYIEIAPRDEFSDILDAADSFIYFQSKTKQKDIQNETK